jgi:hypothetical protein
MDHIIFPSGEDVNFDELMDYYAKTGQDMSRVVFETAPVVEKWKYEYGKSLWDPAKLNVLGTQLFALNKSYLKLCAEGVVGLCVRIRDEWWGRGDDMIFIDFAELHQLFHLDSLDKSIISCYCL